MDDRAFCRKKTLVQTDAQKIEERVNEFNDCDTPVPLFQQVVFPSQTFDILYKRRRCHHINIIKTFIIIKWYYDVSSHS